MSKEKLFKHKTFNQQLAEVKISYFKLGERRVGEKEDDDQLSRSYLYSALEKWIDLDCTEDFSRIIRKLGGLLSISTLPQVLNRKDELIKTIHGELERKENPSLNSLLELLIAFAKDLDEDFYPYFGQTFKLLIGQLLTKNVEIIENVFLTLAYLFKFLWKCMIKDIETIFQLYSDNLLNEQKRDYIVMFSSQSFAFLLRKFETKYESYDRLLTLMFDTIVKKPNLTNGIGYLLFEVVKGVKNQLNSSINVLLPELLDKQNDVKYADSIEVKNCVNYFFNAIANYVDKGGLDVIWSTLIDKTIKQQTNGPLNNNLSILSILICYKNCILVQDPNAIVRLLIEIYNESSHRLDDESNEIVNNITYELLVNKISILTVKNIHLFIAAVIGSKIDQYQKLKFFDKLSAYTFFDRDVLPTLNSFLNENCDLVESTDSSTLNALLKLILVRQSTDFKLKLNQQTADRLFNYFQSAISSNDLNSVWKYVVILPAVDTVSKEQLSKVLIDLLIRCLSDLNDNQSNEQRKSFLIYQLQRSLIGLKDAFDQITPELYLNYLNEHPTQLPVLISFKSYLDSMKKFNLELTSELKTKFEELFFTKLQSNLSHQHSQMRKIVLEILINLADDSIDQPGDLQTESIFSVCLKIENSNFREPRECQRLINKLEYSNTTTNIPKTKNDKYSYKLTPIYHLLGAYYLNYTPFWETIKSVLIGYANNHRNSTELWKIISDHIAHTDQIIYESKLDWINENELNQIEPIDCEIIKLYENEDRPDHFNHRIQLLNLLISTPQIVEKFNRHIVQWFFEFLNNEISTLSISSTLYVEDITRIDEPMEIDGEEMNDELNDPKIDEPASESPNKPTNRPKIFQTFLRFLKLFSTIKNPLAIYEENKLRSLYYQLLENKDTNIQKAAFDCLKTYRFSFLTPYIENIDSLIDINQFKNELVKFNFASRSSSDSLLQDPHRKGAYNFLFSYI